MNRTISFDFDKNLSVKNSYYTNTNYTYGYLIINNTDTNEMKIMKTN